jgi:hypothetical protein
MDDLHVFTVDACLFDNPARATSVDIAWPFSKEINVAREWVEESVPLTYLFHSLIDYVTALH